MKKIKGTGVALITPFQQDQSLDLIALSKIVEGVIAGGVDFLVPLGTTGETATLQEAELEVILQTVTEVNAKRLPVVIGCGGNDTTQVVHKLKAFSQRWNPDAFLSVTPYYNKPSQEGLYKHYMLLADASPVPIILYNVPGRTGVNLLPATVIRLTEHANIIGIKEASGSIEQGMELAAQCPDDFLLLSGDDTLALAHIASGFSGVISVAANGAPGHFSKMIQAALNSDFSTARKFHYELFLWMQLLFKEGNPAGIKAHLANKGIIRPVLRLPLVPVSKALEDAIIEKGKGLRG
jgi:4-hydroxy-tetrahydrodipicolinate synthase